MIRSIRRAALLGLLVPFVANCAGTAGTTGSASSTTRIAPLTSACDVLTTTSLDAAFGERFARGEPAGGAGWIAGQCTWSSSKGLKVSIAVGSTASVAAQGFAGSVSDFVRQRQGQDGQHLTVVTAPVGDTAYLIDGRSPVLVAAKGNFLVQVLASDPGAPVPAAPLSPVASAALARLSELLAPR